ncbi:ABC transporter substrate-binding protein [Phytohabitans sp. ZYX-F-186]|uniref:ABC transporter substrate-binding protein n=1 Tax=Phytohabitans maris TaxID=3071409 RepID=A0ABU0ZUX0_9ACTN|nr:ABC transporter substrate-binding protein [Phytohabitans sp. ZYX-F-186]MDQ7910834.1 ABC transporter substrate-binding protein [Phytohabitans sp. ZYX-F-186]
MSSDVTGPAASNYLPYTSGVKAYFDAVNGKGGINGRKVNVVVLDDQSQAPKGVSNYRRFVTQTPALAFTGLNSTQQSAVAAQSRANNLPFVGSIVTGADMMKPFNKNFYSLACTYPDQAEVAVAFMVEQLGLAAPRIMTSQTPVASGNEWASVVKELVQKAGGTLVANHVTEYGALNEDVFGRDVADKKPDMLIAHGATSTAQVTMKSLAKFGVKNLPIGTAAVLQDGSVPATAPGVVNSYYAFNCYTAPGAAGADGEPLIAAAKAAGLEAKVYDRPEFTQGYTIAMVMAKAIEGAGDRPTRDAVQQQLDKLNELDNGALSPAVTFSPDDHVGIAGVRPYKYNPSSGAFEPVGEFDDYAGCLTNYYVTRSLDSWNKDCIK